MQKALNQHIQGGHGSVRFSYGSCMGRFERFRSLVPIVPLWKRMFSVVALFNRTGRFQFRFRLLKNGSDSSGFQKNLETGRIRFRGVRLQTPNSVSFLGLTEFRGANSVSSSQPIICVPNELTEFFAELTEFAPKLSEFSSPKQYSRNSISPVS